MSKTIYAVQVKHPGGYWASGKFADRRKAERRSQDLAAVGFSGRIVTERTGKVVQEWTITK